jgi:hypothetical protein
VIDWETVAAKNGVVVDVTSVTRTDGVNLASSAADAKKSVCLHIARAPDSERTSTQREVMWSENQSSRL